MKMWIHFLNWEEALYGGFGEMSAAFKIVEGNQKREGTKGRGKISGPTRILKEGGTFLFFRRGLLVVPRSSEQFFDESCSFPCT